MCPYPIYLPHLFISVPCGQCIQCKIQKTRQWAQRVQHESQYWDKSVFVTLTYKPECLPNPPSISVRELQLFFKRLRKNSGRKIAYYACGEYGENRYRPHYHAIIFGISVLDKKLLEDCWRLGFVNLGLVTYESIRYVAQYIDKKYISIETKDVYRKFGYNRPFQLVSKGIGKRWCLENADQLRQDGFLLHKGHEVGLSRYYKDKIQVSKSLLEKRANQYWKEQFNRWVCKSHWNGQFELKSGYFAYMNAIAVQSEANITAKHAISKSRRKL